LKKNNLNLNFSCSEIFFKEADESDLLKPDFLASFFNLKTPIVLNENKLVYLIMNNENIIGFLEIMHVANQCDIIHVEIIEKFRGQGLGRKFLEYAMFDMKMKGILDIFLEVRKSNLVAQKLYSNLGFEQIDVRLNYYNNPTEDALVMVKKNG